MLYLRAVERHVGSVYCPACGKGTCWTGKTDEQKKIEQLERERDQARAARDSARQRETDALAEADHFRRSRDGMKGVVAKIKKRVGRGVCPCCNRHFANLQRHMETQHPEVASGEVSEG